MGNRYCENCGLPVPRKAKICPECRASLNRADVQNGPCQSVPPQFSDEQHTEHRINDKKQPNNKIAIFTAIVSIVLFGILIFNVPHKIKNAISRHRENMMVEQNTETTRPKISIPEISMPEIYIPEIHMPEPPAASFSVESYDIETNQNGETVLYVNVSYTNDAEDKQCFMTNFKISVQQEGEDCKQTALRLDMENHMFDHVQPDETSLISRAFIIDDEKEALVSVDALFSNVNYVKETVLPNTDGTVSVIK